MSNNAPKLPELRLFIDGEWRDASDGGTFTSVNPATEAEIGQIAAATAADVDLAVTAARRQFDGGEWSKLSGSDRGRLLYRLADLLERDLELLADLETLDIGKARVHAPLDLGMAIDTVRHFAGRADSVNGTVFSLPEFIGRPRFSYTLRQPVGVVGAITPWNTPGMILSWKFAPALAVGCTFVVKPPAEASLSTLHIAELVREAGFPAGVFNVVTGSGTVAGAALVDHPGVDKISFTGSPEVGAVIGRAAGESFKKVTLELGGKSPQIIFPDADLDVALPTAAMSLFYNQGETCASATRVLVHESLRDEVLSGLSAQAAAVKVGDPFAPDTTMGSLINRKQMDSVLGYVDAGHREGAELVTGGARIGDSGYFVEPTIFTGTNTMTIAKEEIFGPVGTVIGFNDTEEALRLANETRYGLVGVVYTSDLALAHRAAEVLDVGAVWVNAWGPPDPRMPWGGFKYSGIGTELGDAGIAANTNEKAVSMIL
ncbi:MAG TPA: aldehyde dehydrogenase family protein [Baekduia sp.]|nr:aldehyde dehydrogenase family protein [Baekduia sp.]